MPKFTYNAVDKNGKQRQGTADSASEAALGALLAKQGLRPVSIKKTGGGNNFLSSLTKKKVKSKDITVFTRQLATMINAGVPLVRSLATLQNQTESEIFKTHISEVSKDVESGTNFADSLAKHPSVFSPVYINMVAAGEAAGILDEILGRLAVQQEKSATIRKKVKGAMTYPTILIIITIGSFFGLMLFVIPQIGKILKDLGGEDAQLPFLTQIMLGLSDFLINSWFIILPLFGALIYAVLRFIRTPRGKRIFHGILLKVPVIKNIIIKICIARFSRTFASLMGAGVSVVEALHVTSGAIGNVMYEDALKNSIEQIKNGKQLSETLKNNRLFPDIVSQMLAVGEETGKTDTVLIKVADFYEEEVDVVLESLSSIIEPVMILIMGSMVGLIAASVMGPIASIAQNIKS
jgi:type IV pilus assembly protein PilC